MAHRIPHPHFPKLTLAQVRVLRLFTLLALFSGLVLYAVFRSPRFQDIMRKKSERLLSQAIGRPVKIGGFDLSLLPPAFVVEDVAVANDPRGTPGLCFSADEISLRGIPVVGRESVSLPKVRVLGPRVVFEVFPDGSTNFSSIAAALPKGGGGKTDLRIAEAVLQKGSFRFREWKARLDVALRDVALTARINERAPVTEASLACRNGQLKLEDYGLLDFALGVDLVLSPHRLHFRGIRLDSRELSLDASGGFDDLRRPVLTLAGRLRFEAEALGRYFGVGLPLTGPVTAEASLRVPPGGRFDVRGRFAVAEPARFGPFPMTATGTLHIEPGGVLVHVPRASYAGGEIEALVRVARLKDPPLPVRIVARGRGLRMESFFGDVDLPGTGLMAAADLDTTLTFGPGGIEHADGAGSLRLTPLAGEPSMVKGRNAFPTSGGGPLLVRNGKIVFPGMPLAIGAGLRTTVDGTLTFGSWAPDLNLTVVAPDLAEAERLAANLYPAILKEPLQPPLLLGGSGRLSARLERSWADLRVGGHLDADGFVLRGARFGAVTADFVVDRNVLTLSPFEARDEGGTLTVTGPLGWGGPLAGHYRLDGLTADLASFPLERVLKFLDFDLPLTGPITGRLPLEGVTPAVRGEAPLVWENATIWGEHLDRVEGTLGLEGDRLRLSRAEGRVGGGALTFDGWYRYADGAYELRGDVRDVPVERVSGLAQAAPSLTGTLSGHAAGSGTLDEPGLTASLALADARWDGRALVLPGEKLSAEASIAGGSFSARVESPRAAVCTLGGRASEVTAGLQVSSLALFSPLLGVPASQKLDGSLAVEALCELDPSTSKLASLSGTVRSLDVGFLNHRVVLDAPARIAWSAGRFRLDDAVVRASHRDTPTRSEGEVRLAGTVGTGAPHGLDVGVRGVADAGLLELALPEASLAGKLALDLRLGGTVEKPQVEGKATLDAVDFVASPGSPPVQSITGALVFSPGRVSTSGLTMSVLGGTLDAGGALTLDGTSLAGIRVNGRLTNVRGEPFAGFRATVSGDVVVVGTSEPESLRGDLTLVRGVYDQDLQLGLGTLLGKLRPGAAAAPEPSVFDPMALDLSIAVPPGAIEVRNNVARLRASGDLRMKGTWGRPVLLGQIDAEDGGRLELRGLRYDVTKARILFSDPIRIDPYFDLEARTNVRDYQLGIGLSGTASRMVPRFWSDPPLPEADIVSTLATGELPSGSVGGGVTGTAPISSDESIARAARELIAGLATEAAASRTKELLRLDRLQIDPVFVGNSFDAPRLTVGKSLSRDLTVTFSYKASSNAEQVILVEYQLQPNAFLQLMRDEFGVYSVDVKVRKRLR